jgi:tRNA(Ile)-lysidine synthase
VRAYWKQYGGPGYDVVRAAEETIERHHMLELGETVVVAVSGGPDSTCLLDVLSRLGERFELGLVVAHIDHGLSPESEGIAANVSSRAAKAGFEVHLARAPQLDGPNLHARARDFRYEFLEIVATREGAAKIATGHTLDDRAETTLARLLHGAGTTGLAGLAPRDRKRIRPLIGSRRSETRTYCEEVGLEFVDDPANQDHRFERPKVRDLLISPIDRAWGDGAVRAIARSSERMREDSDSLADIATQLYSEGVKETTDGAVFDLPLVLRMPRALRRRVLELAVGRVRDRSAGIDAVLDALDDVEASDAQLPLRFSVATGIEIAVDKEGVRVVKVEPSSVEDPGA